MDIKKENKKSVLTHSKVRESFFRYLQKERFPQTDLGPPSLRWLFGSSQTGRKVMNTKRIQEITTSILIIQARQDVAISNTYNEIFCRTLLSSCELKIFDGET